MPDGLVDGGGREALPAPSPSPRVDLEAALLATEPGVEARPPAPRRARIVMVISSDPDTRCYIGECLRARPDIRAVEVESSAIAEDLAIHLRPDIVIVDRQISARLAWLPAIRLVDERPPDSTEPVGGAGPLRAWLDRPFNAESLVALVDRMLAG